MVVIGGSIATIAYVTISADPKGATPKLNSGVTPPVTSPPPAPAEHRPSGQQTPSGIMSLLVATQGVPLHRHAVSGLSKLLGATAGMGFVMALGTGIVVVALILVLRILVNV